MKHLKHAYAALVIPLGLTLTAFAVEPQVRAQAVDRAPIEVELEPMTISQPPFRGGQQPGTEAQSGAQIRLRRRKTTRAAPAPTTVPQVERK